MGHKHSKLHPREERQRSASDATPVDEDDTESPTTPVAKRPANIFRVGSRRHNGAYPASPMRSSNYNHVHDAVKVNFELAMSDHGTSMPLGAVGLRNLGNTCFLNSSLQCLSNTIPLTDYFLGYDYRSEINKTNFLGTGGKLATAYAELMKSIWLGKNTVVAPSAFKKSLEKFAPQFAGGRQHDAHEVLSYLLDGIVRTRRAHESLARGFC